MEDFATVIWIVILVGAMVFNAVSKSRKAREKGTGPAPRHGEAWPTINLPGFPAETPSREPEHPVYQPVTPAFPDECQSLEEIPDQEYVPEFTVQKATDSGPFQYQAVNRLKGDDPSEEIAAHALTDNLPAAEKESALAIAEEFDLQRAVIYSEILKPKFED